MDAVTRRDVLKLVGASAGLSLVGSLGVTKSALAQVQDRFVWAGTGGTWGEAIERYFIKDTDFQAIAKVQAVVHSAQLESVAAAKILASCGNAPYDVSSGGQVDYAMLNGANCLQPYDPSIVTNLVDIYPEACLGNYFAAWNLSIFGVTWNTKEAAKPTSFEDLWSEKYKDRVGIPAYGWYGMLWLHAINKLHGGTEDNVDPGIQAISDLVKKNGAILIENADHATKLMQQGDVVIMPYLNGRTYRMIEAGVPCDFAFVPGMIPIGNGFSIMAGTRNLEAAQKFINMTLDPEMQVKFAQWSKYPPTNRRCKLPADLEYINIPDGSLGRASNLDWAKINQHRAAYLNRWNREVLA